MRIAVISDIHGNLTALDAVVADLGRAAPDLVLHAGDLATHGHRPAEVVDLIRERGWPGVYGNTDEMLWAGAQELDRRVAEAPKLRDLLQVLFLRIRPATRDRLGSERISWLRQLPPLWRDDALAILHASPGNPWQAPMPDASPDALTRTYADLAAPLVVYGHIHRPFVRSVGRLTVANSGSVGLPYDGDRRAAYLLVDDGVPTMRRVEYDIDREVGSLLASGYPCAEWLAGMLRTGRYSAPPLPDTL
jgi:predicted phosphodiesterase